MNKKFLFLLAVFTAIMIVPVAFAGQTFHANQSVFSAHGGVSIPIVDDAIVSNTAPMRDVSACANCHYSSQQSGDPTYANNTQLIIGDLLPVQKGNNIRNDATVYNSPSFGGNLYSTSKYVIATGQSRWFLVRFGGGLGKIGKLVAATGQSRGFLGNTWAAVGFGGCPYSIGKPPGLVAIAAGHIA